MLKRLVMVWTECRCMFLLPTFCQNVEPISDGVDRVSVTKIKAGFTIYDIAYCQWLHAWMEKTFWSLRLFGRIMQHSSGRDLLSYFCCFGFQLYLAG